MFCTPFENKEFEILFQSQNFSEFARSSSNGECCNPCIFFLAEWNLDRRACIDELLHPRHKHLHSALGCKREDGIESSNAGAFLSILDVNHEGLENAVDQVVEAYGTVNGQDEVLIQPMLSQVLRSGVAFSHDPNTCAPYRVVNWSEGNNTSTVTSGLGEEYGRQHTVLFYLQRICSQF